MVWFRGEGRLEHRRRDIKPLENGEDNHKKTCIPLNPAKLASALVRK